MNERMISEHRKGWIQWEGGDGTGGKERRRMMKENV